MERYIRSFKLTPEICDKLDSLPNRSAWMRNLLQEVLVDRAVLVVSRDEITRMIDTRLSSWKGFIVTNDVSCEMENDVSSELDAILEIAAIGCATP